jgi:hypothetical protein
VDGGLGGGGGGFRRSGFGRVGMRFIGQ